MSILIKGMEMPKGCFECPLSHNQFDGEETVLACFALREIVSDDGEIADNCPLADLPLMGHDVFDILRVMFNRCKVLTGGGLTCGFCRFTDICEAMRVEP